MSFFDFLFLCAKEVGFNLNKAFKQEKRQNLRKSFILNTSKLNLSQKVEHIRKSPSFIKTWNQDFDCFGCKLKWCLRSHAYANRKYWTFYDFTVILRSVPVNILKLWKKIQYIYQTQNKVWDICILFKRYTAFYTNCWILILWVVNVAYFFYNSKKFTGTLRKMTVKS